MSSIQHKDIKNIFNKERKIICVQGLGFVGAAMCVAISTARDDKNEPLYNVIGIDVPGEEGERKANSINKGIFPFENNDNTLEKRLNEAVINNNNLWATVDKSYYGYADIVVVDVNLDVKYYKNQEPFIDLDPFKDAIRTLGSNICADTLVLIETTVPPGTCQKVVFPILKEEFLKRNIYESPKVAHSYERVMPGENYLNSIISYWRVYSGIDDNSADICRDFLQTVISTDKYPLTKLKNTTSTETAKVLENSYRAVNIAFMEEWGRFAEAVDVDIFEVVDAIRMRPTHSNIRQPGFGVGGYCLTKDPYFGMLASRELFAKELSFPFSTQAIKINNLMPIVSLDYIEKLLGDLLRKKILLMGVSYRPDVGDTRYSPSMTFSREAMRRGAIITYQDPLVKYWVEMNVEVIQEIPSFNEYDAVVFAVQHKQYASIDFSKLSLDHTIFIFDSNRVMNDKQLDDASKNEKVILKCIGRGM